MTDITKAIAAARELHHNPDVTYSAYWFNEYQSRMGDLLAALDATQEPIGFYDPQEHKFYWAKPMVFDVPLSLKVPHLPLFTAPQAPPAEVPAANITPMRQPRADLARLVESINAAVYANGDGLSVTEAIGALELLKEQEQ